MTEEIQKRTRDQIKEEISNLILELHTIGRHDSEQDPLLIVNQWVIAAQVTSPDPDRSRCFTTRSKNLPFAMALGLVEYAHQILLKRIHRSTD